MTILNSSINSASAEFKSNAAVMAELVEDLRYPNID